MTKRPLSQALIEGTASRLAGRGVSRRRFLSRTAVVGSALAVAPGRFLFRPTTAYAATISTVCGPASDCAGGFTVFCCTINNGVNQCPPGSFAGGWWRADGSSWCCGGSRYIIDCQSRCTACGCSSGSAICPDSCQNCSRVCHQGPTCDRRRVCMNRFRYGQCNQQIGCSGNVLCRMVTCTPPWQIPSLACASSPTLTDHATAQHGAPCLQQGSWQGGATLVRPDGVLASAPSVAQVRGFSRRDVFVLGTDGGIWWTSRPSQGWTGWSTIGAPPVGAVGVPAAVSWAPGRLDVFVRGGDNKLWQRFSLDGGVSWSAWFQPVGADGTLASSPHVVSWAADRLDVFVLGTDGQIYSRTYAGGWSPFWQGLGAPAAGIAGRPTAASWGAGRLDLFVTGGDSRLYRRSYSNGWSGWGQPPGTESGVLTAPPAAASWGSNQVAVFVRGTDGGLYWANFYQGYWSGWMRLGNPNDAFRGQPSATSRGCQQLEVFVQGTDDRCYQYTYSG